MSYKHWVLLIVAVANSACGSSGETTETAQVAQTDSTAAGFVLTTKFTGPTKPLGIEAGINGMSSPVLVDLDESTSQPWLVEANNDGLYTISSLDNASQLYLGVGGEGSSVELLLTTQSSSEALLWQITPLDNGYCRLSPLLLGSGQSLDIVNNSEDNILKFDTSLNVTGQQWKIEKVSGNFEDENLNQCAGIDELTAAVGPTSFLPTDSYRTESMLGFNLLVNPELDAMGMLRVEVMAEIQVQLAALQAQVPGHVLSQLQSKPIWIELNQLDDRSGQFHVSEGWLSANGYNPDKAGSVEVSNARIFLKDASTLNARTVVHELAHAREFYLTVNEGFDFQTAFEQARTSGIYESVEYADGSRVRAYAISNYKEYFAELSEAYFGTNDFFPTARSELLAFDAIGYEMVQQAWGQP